MEIEDRSLLIRWLREREKLQALVNGECEKREKDRTIYYSIDHDEEGIEIEDEE
jgi:hypothetical protein